MLKIDIHKTFGTKKDPFQLQLKAEFKEGEITALYGPSGVGKTTVLRLIAGLENPDKGEITYNDQLWFNDRMIVPLKDRPVGIVFQEFNLFRNMTVLQNLEFASEQNTVSTEIKAICDQLGITDLFSRKPHQLSKGQQQKIAIVRTLCQKNEILLLDEPFSALDDQSIKAIIQVIDQYRVDQKMTVILVSHRKDVILKMAQSFISMETGEPAKMISVGF